MRLFALVATAASAVFVAPAPVAVQATARDERAPAAGSGWFAWAQNSPRDRAHFDTFVRRLHGKPRKVNEPGTVAFPGGIAGTTLVYTQGTGYGAGIWLYDLRFGTRSPVRGASSPRWEESNPTLSR